MRVWFIRILSLVVIICASGAQAKFAFEEKPAVQSFTSSDGAPASSTPPPPAEQAKQPKPPAKQQRAAAPQPSAQDTGGVFLQQPTTVSHTDFSAFKKQVQQAFSNERAAVEHLTEQFMQLQLKQQKNGSELASMRQAMVQIGQLLGQVNEKLKSKGVQQSFAGGNMFWYLGAVVLLVVVLFVLAWLWLRRQLQSPRSAAHNGADYDFMGTVDSIPARLDLARTYIKIADYDRARKVLEWVIMKDKGQLREQASELMRQIPKD